MITVELSARARDRNITKAVVCPSSILDICGWTYKIYFGDKVYPSVVGGLYTTEEKAFHACRAYIETNKTEYHGDAEMEAVS